MPTDREIDAKGNVGETMKRKTRNTRLAAIGFTRLEIQAVEELAASTNVNAIQVLRNGLRFCELQHKGVARMVFD